MLLLSIILLLIWTIVFCVSSKTRLEQVAMSLVGVVIAPGAILMTVGQNAIDKVKTAISLEDFIFSFALFGLAAVIYQVLMGRHIKQISAMHGKKIQMDAHWIYHLVLLVGIWIILALSFYVLLELNGIRSAIVGGLLIGVYVIAQRHDLLLNALLSGLMTAGLIFLLEQAFYLRVFAMPIPHTIPLEELLWAATIGFAIGPLYEYLRHLRLV